MTLPALATTEDVEAVLQRDIPLQDRTRVERLLVLASGPVRELAGQDISPVAGDVVELDAHGGTRLWLPQRPVTAVNSITVDGNTVSAHTYKSTPTGLLLRLGTGNNWWALDGKVVVDYDHGWSPNQPTIAFIVAEMVAYRIANPDMIRSESHDDYTVGYAVPATGTPMSFGITDEHKDTILKLTRAPRDGSIEVSAGFC